MSGAFGPYGTCHAGCPWCLCARRPCACRPQLEVVVCCLSVGCLRARPPARSPHASLRLGVVYLEARPCPPGPTAPATLAARGVDVSCQPPSGTATVPSGPYGTRHTGCPWCWCPVKPCRTKTQVFGLSRRDAIQTKGPGGRQSSRARCVTQGSDRYSPSTGVSAATSTASPDTAPPTPVTRPPATKSTISAHSRANDESSSASAA